MLVRKWLQRRQWFSSSSSCNCLILCYCSCFFPLCSSFLFDVLLLFLFYLSTMFTLLCNGFVAVLLFSMVHSGGFVVAEWLFPCSLLLLMLLPRFFFFVFVLSLSGFKNNLPLFVFCSSPFLFGSFFSFFPFFLFSPLPLFISISFTKNFLASPSFPLLFFNSGFSSPQSCLFSLCFVFFLRFFPLFFLSISPFVSSFNLFRSS